MPYSAVTRRANQATAGDLAVSVSPTHTMCDTTFSVAIKTTAELGDAQREQIWHMLEENMYQLYRASSFGWNPRKKKKEMFDPRSRFVIVHNASDPTDMGVIAYAIFRFERENRQNVVYCYELQVSKDFRRFGLGRLLMQLLSDVGARWDMSKIMLAVFKANHTATLFYTSVGFITDETSPDAGEGTEDEYDYAVLSKCVP